MPARFWVGSFLPFALPLNASFSTAKKVKIVMQATFKQARKSRLIQYDHWNFQSRQKGRIEASLKPKAILVADDHYAGLMYF